MRKAFEQKLSEKERAILGGFFGVFGHREQTLEELGELFDIQKGAALAAKDKALKKLAKICLEGELGIWRDVYNLTFYEIIT